MNWLMITRVHRLLIIFLICFAMISCGDEFITSLSQLIIDRPTEDGQMLQHKLLKPEFEVLMMFALVDADCDHQQTHIDVMREMLQSFFVNERFPHHDKLAKVWIVNAAMIG